MEEYNGCMKAFDANNELQNAIVTNIHGKETISSSFTLEINTAFLYQASFKKLRYIVMGSVRPLQTPPSVFGRLCFYLAQLLSIGYRYYNKDFR